MELGRQLASLVGVFWLSELLERRDLVVLLELAGLRAQRPVTLLLVVSEPLKVCKKMKISVLIIFFGFSMEFRKSCYLLGARRTLAGSAAGGGLAGRTKISGSGGKTFCAMFCAALMSLLLVNGQRLHWTYLFGHFDTFR